MCNITQFFPNVYSTPLMGRRNPESQNSGSLGESRNPQVLDSATKLIFGFLGMIFVSFLHRRNEKKEVVPHSSEMNTLPDSGPEEGTPASSLNAQNVHFTDAHPGFVDDRGWTNADPLRDSTLIDDAPLENFFSRPIKVYEYEWPVGAGSPLNVDFDPWTLFFENKRVINRLTNFKLMKANLRVKFMLNGNAFYYGRLLASYKLAPSLDDTTLFRSGVSADFVEASQRPHVYLNPTESQGGELFLPFFTPLNMLDIPGAGWSHMGRITIATLQPLLHANGATTPVTVSVFVWAENVDLSVLTQTDPSSVVPQAREEWQGIVSKPASAVAKIAGALTKVPMISNFATATEIGARSIGQMAALFGYSKPKVPEIPPLQPMTRQSMADTDGKENLVRLVVDTKNELSIDPAIAGIEANDELVIHSIASRESYLTTFDWNVGTPVEQLLFNTIVDPAVHARYGSNPSEIHMPACCFASMPFEYWKGSLKYRFSIVCSGYHKGRLKFVYDPQGTPQDGSSEYNTAYTQIVDIAENNDFCLEIGWGQNIPWRHHLGLNYVQMFGTSPLAFSSDLVGNGTLSVYVVNELTVPNSTVTNDIQVNVFVSACEDFELAAPNDIFLNQLGFSAPTPDPPPRNEIVPQAEEIDNVPIAGPPVLNRMGPSCPTSSLINRIHMGEAVTSFRTLLKRYNLHEVMIAGPTYPEGGSFGTIVRFVRNMFPHTPGYTTSNPLNSDLIHAIPTGKYVYAKMTLMNYLKPAFGAWRGSIRYTVDTTLNMVTDLDENSRLGDMTWSVTRLPSNLGFNASPNDDTIIPNDTVKAGVKYDLLRANRYAGGITGVTRWTSKVNPIQTFEIPYYTHYRFSPAKKKTIWTGSDPYQSSFELLGSLTPGVHPLEVYSYVAAGEDFTFLFYLSPPVYYLQSLPPATEARLDNLEQQ